MKYRCRFGTGHFRLRRKAAIVIALHYSLHSTIHYTFYRPVADLVKVGVIKTYCPLTDRPFALRLFIIQYDFCCLLAGRRSVRPEQSVAVAVNYSVLCSSLVDIIA